MAQVSEITVLDAAGQAKDVATLTAIAALIGEVQANPTENTLLDRLKDIVSAVAAIPAGGDASAANQVTIIAALTAIAGFVDGLEGKDYATQTTLASVLAKITAAAATEAKQDTIIGHVDGIETLITALNALVTTQNGYLDNVESLIGTTNTTLNTIDGRVDTLEAAIGPTNEAAASSDAGTFGLNALIKRQLAKMTSALVTQLGARTVAQSPAINIATDDPQIGTKVTAVAALGAGGAGLIGWLSQIWDRVGTIGTRTYGTIERVGVASTAAQSAAITGTEVLLHASTRCYVLAGSGTPTPTATTGIPLEAGEKFHMRITAGHKIGVIRDSVDGFLHVVTVA